MPPKTERRQRQGRETRERILDATIEIAAERGYDGTTMSATAKRVELLVSSTYWHFTDNDDLIAAVILPSFEAWLQTAVQWDAPVPGVLERDHLADSVCAEAVALLANPEFLRLGLMLALERRPQQPKAREVFLEVRAGTFERLRQAFARMLDEDGTDSTAASFESARPTVLATVLATVVMALADVSARCSLQSRRSGGSEGPVVARGKAPWRTSCVVTRGAWRSWSAVRPASARGLPTASPVRARASACSTSTRPRGTPSSRR